ncbi:MAG: endonuclease/exonuclease/phosphatase family protein [Pyrinomonadaceae bacterium]|nr:endonuclease/exonuclease/phosphatase family protein [Pyrinomonadaceae bacterium]
MKKLILVLILTFLFIELTAAQSLKVMTYNIRLDLASDKDNAWNNRKDFFISQMKFYEPDIFGVQEALPNQINDLTANLPAYSHIGIGRDEGGKGEASAIFFKRNRFKVSGENTFWLSETPEKSSKSWDAAYPRICTFGLFKDLKTKKTFRVFNTHLDHVGEVARTRGIEMILAKIRAVNTKDYPVFFMGDFNSEPDTERIKNLKKAMTDSRDASESEPFGPSGSFNGFKFNEPVTRLIDYIFIDNSKRIRIKKYAVLSDSMNLHFPSDHFPIFVEAEIGK